MAAHARDVNILIWTSRKSVGRGINDRAKVHGEGTRADGRRFGYSAHIDLIVWLRDPKMLGAGRRSREPTIWLRLANYLDLRPSARVTSPWTMTRSFVP